MAADDAFNTEFWLTVATAAPVLLVAFGTTFVELFTRNRDTARYRRRLDRLWATLWINAVPIIGGLLTLGAVAVLAWRHDNVPLRWIAMVALAALLLGLISSGLTLVSLLKRFPPNASWTPEGRGPSRRS